VRQVGAAKPLHRNTFRGVSAMQPRKIIPGTLVGYRLWIGCPTSALKSGAKGKTRTARQLEARGPGHGARPLRLTTVTRRSVPDSLPTSLKDTHLPGCILPAQVRARAAAAFTPHRRTGSHRAGSAKPQLCTVVEPGHCGPTEPRAVRLRSRTQIACARNKRLKFQTYYCKPVAAHPFASRWLVCR
jgi:hypothetical protein